MRVYIACMDTELLTNAIETRKQGLNGLFTVRMKKTDFLA